MTATTGGWRLAARLARREVRRRPGRSALVTALVAVPVAGMLVGVAYQRADELSAAESWRLLYGRADVVLHLQPGVPFPALPEGSRSVDVSTTERVVASETGLCHCELTDIPDDPITDGAVHVTRGRLPRDADEVVLSAAAARSLGVGRGDRLALGRPVEVDATVVGVAEPRLWGSDSLVVVGPGVELLDDSLGLVSRLVDLPDDLTAAELAGWEATAGPHAMSPAYEGATAPWTNSDSQNVEVRWTWAIGAVGLTVLGIVIAAAFAAGARRQLVMLGQLAANGATPAGLRRVLFLQGTVAGLIGTAVGLVLGAGILTALRSRASDLLAQPFSGWEVRLLDVLPIVGIAVVAATLAAMVPARGASRVSVLTALAGRRPLGRVSGRRTAAGLFLAASGLGLIGAVVWAGRDGIESASVGLLSVVALVGPVLLLLGVCTAAPAYVTVLRPLASAARGPWRLAARSLFRSRSRTSALVSAICAISAVAVAAASIGLGIERTERDRVLLGRMADDVVAIRSDQWLADTVLARPDIDALADPARRAEQVVPGAERATLSTAVVPGAETLPAPWVVDLDAGGDEAPWVFGSGQVTIADDELRRVFDLDEEVDRALERHGAVLFGEDEGEATVEAATYEVPTDPAVREGSIPPTTRSTVRFDAAVLTSDQAFGSGVYGQLLMTPQRAEELGFVPVPAEVVLRAPAPLTAAQRHDLEQLTLALQTTNDEEPATSPPGGPEPRRVWVEFQEPSFYAGPDLVEAVPAAIALLFTLFVVATGLALAAAETRDERATLTVLGAAPAAVRRTSAYKALLLTLLGGALAVPVGMAPLVVWSRTSSQPVDVLVPWRTVGVLVVAVPLAAALATALAAWAGARWGRGEPVAELPSP